VSDAPARSGPSPDGIRRLELLLPGLVVALVAILSLRRLDNTDTWFHLSAGRWIVEHGSIPPTDTLSWTVRDHTWINVQWLFDVLMYGLYRLGGPSLLVIVSAIAYSATTALLLVNLRRYVGPITASLFGAWAVIISQSRFEIRPEMASYLLIQVILWLYATGRVPGRKRLWFLPVVMCLFANFHSLFIVGVVMIVCEVAGTLLSRIPLLPSGWRRPVDPRVRSQVVATGAAALAATVVNPFLLKGAVFPIVLMSELSGKQPFLRAIGELKPPFDNYFVTFSLRAYRVLFLFAVAVVAVTLLVTAVRGAAADVRAASGGRRSERRRRERQRDGRRERAAVSRPESTPAEERSPRALQVDLGDVAVLVGVGYLSLLARRNIALFAMAGGPPLASCLSVLAARIRPRASAAFLFARRAFAVFLAAALVAACWFVATNGYYRWNDELHETGLGILDNCFPIRAAAFMKEQKLPAPAFNDFTNGGYFTWAEPVPGGVYVDGRGEVYGVGFLGPYGYQVQHPDEWQVEMDRRGVQTASLFHWWPNHQALLRHLLGDSRWSVVYYDETTVVAVRRKGNEETIARAALAFLEGERKAAAPRLLEPKQSWQWQLARARGLTTYANLLSTMGRGEDARRLREELSRINLRRG
jgi:hypothetical protein